MKPQDQPSSISEVDVETLARVARVQVSQARIPCLVVELESALQAARDLQDAADRAPVPGSAPFDPAWDAQRRRTGR